MTLLPISSKFPKIIIKIMYSYQCCLHRSHSHRRDCWAPRSRSCVEGAGSDGQDGGPSLAYICIAFFFAGYHYDHKVHLYKEYHMFPRRNWDSPNPSPASPPEPKVGGGEHTRLRVRGWRSPSSDDCRKSLALCLLYGYDLLYLLATVAWCSRWII